MTPTEQQSFVATGREADTAPGRRLREAREAANLSLAEVASQLHLERRAVEFLERDEYDKLHAPTFVRGYLSSYARLLHLPERPILEAYDRRGFGPPALVPDIAQKPQIQVSDLPVRMVTYLITGMLVLLVFLWWQSRQTPLEEKSIADATEEAAPPPSAAVGEPAPAGAPEETPASSRPPPLPSNVPGKTMPERAPRVARTEQAFDRTVEGDATRAAPGAGPRESDTGGTLPSPSGNAAGAVTELASASQEPPGSNAAPGGNAPADPSTTSAEVPVPPSGAAPQGTPPDAASGRVAGAPPGESPTRPAEDGPRVATGADRAVVAAAPEQDSGDPLPNAPPVPLDGDDVLRMDFSRPSWVEVYDRDGNRLYYSLAKEGGEILLRGAGPMRVLLGDVEGAQIVYNGEPFDLGRYAGRKVARFVVGEGTPAPARRPAPTSEPQPEEGATASAARPAVAEAPDAEMSTGGDGSGTEAAESP